MPQAPEQETPSTVPTGPASETKSSQGRSRLPSIASVVIALVALVIAVSAWFRPLPKPEAPPVTTYSAQEVADAKKAVCDAYEKANRGVQVAGAGISNNTDASVVAVATNVRLALTAANLYLTQIVDEHPAAPTELNAALANLSRSYQNIAISQLGEVPHSELRPLFQAGDDAATMIKHICE